VKITPGLAVELEYRLLDDEQEVVESSEQEGPMLYVQGEGQLPPALEARLLGAAVGDRLRVTLEPEEAFGPYDPEGMVSVPRSDFPPDALLEEGEWIELHLAPEEGEEEDEEGHGDLQARVVEFDEESVVLDTNPPLAGMRVTFDVRVLSVRVPTDDDWSRIAELTD
jgi:FKBP-type peptidyl-prolyl cis-trans isomerase SlyD